MRFITPILFALLLFNACKSSTSAKSDAEENIDLSTSINSTKFTDATVEFVDEYADNEYFDLDSYLVSEESIPADSIEHIAETCFVQVWRPEIKEFEDEESEDAEAYFVAMDDLAYYMYETSERMKELGITEISSKKRFQKFDIAGRHSIVVDIEKNEKTWFLALLYKKGKKPIVIDITDSSTDRVNSYLNQ